MAETEVWSELHHEFRSDANGSLKMAINAQAILSSIDNILGTRLGERVMLPTFGSQLWNNVFNPIDAHISDFLSSDVQTVIEKWDDRVKVQAVNVKGSPDTNTVDITISVSIRGFNNIFTFTKTV